MINKSNIGEVTIEQKDFKVTIKQKEEQITQVVAAPMHQLQPCSANPSCACTSAPAASICQPLPLNKPKQPIYCQAMLLLLKAR